MRMCFGCSGVAEAAVIPLTYCTCRGAKGFIKSTVLGKGRLCADVRRRWLVARGILLHIVDIAKPHVCLVRLIALVENLKAIKSKFFSK